MCAELAQNERLVAVVKIESDEAHGRVLLVDRLPSGLEIDNPRLVEGGDVSNLEWLKDMLKPQHTEFRDDRFVAAFDLSAKPATSGDGGGGRAKMKRRPIRSRRPRLRRRWPTSFVP